MRPFISKHDLQVQQIYDSGPVDMPLQRPRISSQSISNFIFPTIPDGSCCCYLPTTSQTHAEPSIFGFVTRVSANYISQTKLPVGDVVGRPPRKKRKKEALTV